MRRKRIVPCLKLSIYLKTIIENYKAWRSQLKQKKLLSNTENTTESFLLETSKFVLDCEKQLKFYLSEYIYEKDKKNTKVGLEYS